MDDLQAFTQLQAKLNRLANQGGRQASKKGMRAAVKVRAKAVRERAPVKSDTDKWFPQTALEPGAVKADIKTSVKDGEKVDEIDGTVFPGDDTGHVQYFVEMGHRLVVGGYSKVKDNGKLQGPGHQRGYIQPHPFWRPAEEESEAAAVTAYVETACAEIEKLWDEET